MFNIGSAGLLWKSGRSTNELWHSETYSGMAFNVDRRVGLSFTSVGSRDHELRFSQMHRRGVAA